jgi:hypothetical protein
MALLGSTPIQPFEHLAQSAYCRIACGLFVCMTPDLALSDACAATLLIRASLD